MFKIVGKNHEIPDQSFIHSINSSSSSRNSSIVPTFQFIQKFIHSTNSSSSSRNSFMTFIVSTVFGGLRRNSGAGVGTGGGHGGLKAFKGLKVPFL
jgi:hypothetical protein